ncbi:DNA repair protein RAD51 4 isoform X1 [Histomonas meleagridis]|uniref:DNA repair protein RAD51-like 4 isoform X1 n=1 Tax=Histomonas meleagridis TaxID=135588 RepID=UPI00355964EB|nr:DNA repair protein RAD51 4 isoform X1 [Histomonas meleagridis]KAH0798184.1 DNA repair protein RAD51-like 4 isoform X1 [Histomonas meleagridis]
MKQRTAISLSLDKHQKTALLEHSIWSYENIPNEELDQLFSNLEIPKIIPIRPSPIQRNEDVQPFMCGINSVDSLISPFLGGCLTEICGLPGSGRTTLCLRYAQQLNPNYRTLWIDTEGCIVPPNGLSLPVIRIHDHIQFFALTHCLPAIISNVQPRLIVVDSIAATMRGEAANEAQSRTSLLWEFAKVLKRIASETGCAVLVTNHMSFMQYHGFIRTLGQSWANAPTHCFEVKKSGSGTRTLRVLKSPCLPRIDIEMLPTEGQ